MSAQSLDNGWKVKDFSPGTGLLYVIFRTPDWLDVGPIQLFSELVIPALS